jgi:hypothetical protein
MDHKTRTAFAAYSWLLLWSGLLLGLAGITRWLEPPSRSDFRDLLSLGLAGLAIISGLGSVYVGLRRPQGRTGGAIRNFLLLAAAGIGAFPVAVLLHNTVSAFLGDEEVIFFVVAVWLAPLAVLIGSLGAVGAAIAAANRVPSPR